MPSSSPAPLEPAETVTISRFFGWIIFVPLILIGGCVVGAVAVRLLRAIVPVFNQYSGSLLPEYILISVAAGSCMAILIGLLWMPYAYLGDWRWWCINILLMSGAVFATTMVVFNNIAGECETFPLRWVAPTAVTGLGLGVIHWFSLRRQMRRAGWWILAMAGSWMLVWFFTVGFGCVLSD